MPRLTKAWRLTPFLLLPATLGAQGGGRGLELHLGRWYNGNRADVYELRTTTRLGGPFTHGFGVTLLVNDTLGRRRAFYGLGYEMQVGRGRATLGPYALTDSRWAFPPTRPRKSSPLSGPWEAGSNGGRSPGLPWEASCAIASRIGGREGSGIHAPMRARA